MTALPLSPQQIDWTVSALVMVGILATMISTVIAIAVGVRHLRSSGAIKPQPLSVKKFDEIASREDVNAVKALAIEANCASMARREDSRREISTLRGEISSKLEGLEHRLEDNGAERTGKIHGRIDVLVGAVGEMRGVVNQINERLRNYP